MKCSAFGQKGVIYFWQSVDAIFEDVSVTKTIVWCKNINQQTSIFQCSKIHGNSTNVTYSPIAFHERVTCWLQHSWSLPCACVFAALYACAVTLWLYASLARKKCNIRTRTKQWADALKPKSYSLVEGNRTIDKPLSSSFQWLYWYNVGHFF